jgi:hypothetical protein
MSVITIFLSFLLRMWKAQEQRTGIREKITMATTTMENTYNPGDHLGNVSYDVFVLFSCPSTDLVWG